MKTILLLAALASSSATLRYDLHGDRADAVDNEMPSCGASERLLKDHYAVVIDTAKRTATVNRTPWALAYSEDGIVLTHEASPEAYTRLSLYIDTSGERTHARLILTGFTEDRQACADRVILIAR